MVEIRCYLLSAALKKDEWIAIASLPEGFIPSETFYGFCYNNPLSDSRTSYAIAKNGQIYANNNATANMLFIFQCTYTIQFKYSGWFHIQLSDMDMPIESVNMIIDKK